MTLPRLTPYNPNVPALEAPPRDKTANSSSNSYWVVVGGGFLLLLESMGFGRFTYPMLLPSMQDTLGQTYGPMGILGTTNLIGYLCGVLLPLRRAPSQLRKHRKDDMTSSA